LRKWNPAELPEWLDEETYKREILPRLSKFTVKAIRLRLDVSDPYATLIKRGLKIPHPRHWMPLAELSSQESQKSNNGKEPLVSSRDRIRRLIAGEE
jgi:hypothetical protein